MLREAVKSSPGTMLVLSTTALSTYISSDGAKAMPPKELSTSNCESLLNVRSSSRITTMN